MIKKIKNIYNNLKSKASPNSKYYAESTICKEWVDSFDSFYNWMISNNYKEGDTIYSETNHFSPSTSIVISQKEARRLNLEKNNLKKYGVKNVGQLESVINGNKERCIDEKCCDVEFFKTHGKKIRSIYNISYNILCQEWKDDFWLFSNFLIKNNWKPGLLPYSEDIISPESYVLLDSYDVRNKKSRATCIEKYGVSNPSLVEEFKEKRSNTNLERYGVENASSSDTIKEKRQETILNKYGVENVFQIEEVKEKIASTNMEKYGVTNPSYSNEIKEKIKKILIERYGENYSFVTEESLRKRRETLVKNNKIILVEGKSLYEIGKEFDVFSGILYSRYRAGINTIKQLIEKRKSSIEIIIEDLLISNNIDYIYNKSVGNYRPDFLFNNIVVEANGNYWHSDAINQNDLYHKEKREAYIENGYKPLFFCEDEILNKKNIVESIILNKLNMSDRIFGRKTIVSEIDTDTSNKFFSKNHLMGKGKGLTFGLIYNNELVSAIRIVKKNDGLDVSRFCNKLKTNIIGGFSKLINYTAKKLSPKFIETFIDLRYGSGDYLPSLGFKKETEYLSFHWIRGDERVHRMKFPGNTGYDYGYYKLWDCGQARYRKYL
jgi:hypothetical protein